MSPRVFVEKLRRLRKGLGISQAEAARILGVKPNSLARWERGERTPPSEADLPLSRERILDELRKARIRIFSGGSA